MISKDILSEIDNNITDEELIAICSEEILLERKEYNLHNFILKVKKLNYQALPHFKYIKKHLSKITQFKFFKKNQNIRRLVKYIAKMELAEYLLQQGATIEEIKNQTDIEGELLALVIKKNYSNIPKEILRFRLLNYRILKLAKMQEIIFKETVIPLLQKQDSSMAYNLLKSFEDLTMSSVRDRLSIESELLKDRK